MEENLTPPTPEPSSAAPAPTPPPLRQAPPPFTPPAYAITPARPRSGSGWKIFAIICAVLLLLSMAFNSLHLFSGMMSSEGGLTAGHRSTGPRLQENWLKESEGQNKIAVIPVEGVIMGKGVGRGAGMVELLAEQPGVAGTAQRESIYLKKRFSDHAPLTIDYRRALG